MRRHKTVVIGDIFKDLLKETGLDQGLLRMKVFDAWDNVVGDKYKQYTTEKYFKDGRLICKISSSSARNQLFMHRVVVLERMNGILGSEVVKLLILK